RLLLRQSGDLGFPNRAENLDRRSFLRAGRTLALSVAPVALFAQQRQATPAAAPTLSDEGFLAMSDHLRALIASPVPITAQTLSGLSQSAAWVRALPKESVAAAAQFRTMLPVVKRQVVRVGFSWDALTP